MGRYGLLLAGDADPEAVAATRENVGRRYKPIEIVEWDARSLPLETSSVSALACNLPFGKQVGTAADNRSLYPALFREWTRVVRPHCRLVALTSERSLMQNILKRTEGLNLERSLTVLVRGMPATLYVIRRV